MSTPRRSVAVVGGGVAGLAAAYTLGQAGVPLTLIERSGRVGGLVQTVEHDGCRVEFGPDAFITRKPWALALARALGLGDAVIPVNPTRERIYVLAGGRLAPLPDGLNLLVPTKIGPFLRSPLLTPWGKLRMLADVVIPPKGDDADETLADFVRRRCGAEALDRLADPLLSGVYNAEMERQSILATFPQYRQIEARHGSLIRGMRAAARTAPADTSPALVSFAGGMGQFIDALAAAVTGEVRLNTAVTALARDGDGWRLHLDGGETLDAGAVVLATPANVTAALLADVAPDAAAGLRGIRYEGVGSTSLAFRAADVPHPLDAYGIVVPASAGRRIDGMQWSSSKWPNRAPDGVALLRVFFGGPHTRTMLDYDDEHLLRIIRDELRAILGITAAPLHTTTGRWRAAYPQYDLGHIERVDRVFAALPDGVALAGNAYRGVGLPDTIHTAQAAAERVAHAIG